VRTANSLPIILADLRLDAQSQTPLYQQLYAVIRDLILRGVLPAGVRLPTNRALASQLGLARVTVASAYAQLRDEGYLVSRQGAGTFVAEELVTKGLPATAPFQPRFSFWGQRLLTLDSTDEEALLAMPRPEIDFGFGRSFYHIFPYDVWRRLLARYLSADDAMLSRYGSVAGFYPLRAAVAGYLERLRGVQTTAEQVVIVSGIQQALDILSRLLLNRGAGVLVETPGYSGAVDIFRLYGAHIQPLPVDDHGLPVERIPPATIARLAFVTPSNQFPRGGAMPLARRLALLKWAQEQGAIILEDDYDGELRYSGHPLAALQGLDRDGRVVYLGAFSKVLFPALRLSYVVLPEPLLDPFLHTKRLIDRGAPTLTQAAVADFITEGHFERHLRRLRQEYGERRAALTAALDAHLAGRVRYSAEAAGLHVMLYLQNGLDETAVVERAARLGVGVYPGAPYHLQHPAPPSILLGFSGLTVSEIETGIRRLAMAVRSET
jgi:GntR family transcriptional regulator / MocR family aminotransferase